MLLPKIENYISNLHKDSLTECGLCEMQYFQFQSTLLYRVPLYTTEKCPVSTLIEDIRSLVITNADTPPLVCDGENGDLVFIMLKLYQKQMPRADIYHGTSYVGEKCKLRPTEIDRSLWQVCPRFHLIVDDLFKLSSYSSAIETYLNPKAYVSICVDTYFKLSGQSAAARLVPIFCKATMVFSSAILFACFLATL